MPDTNKNDRLDPKEEAMKVLREDLVGSKDWQKSKFGYLTGYTAGKRAVTSIGDNIGQSTSNIFRMMRGLLPTKEELPSLPDGGETDERFLMAMELHERTESDLQVMQIVSYRAVMLYLAVSIAFFIAVLVSLYTSPGGSIFANVVRFGPFPLLLILLYKHAYTNWFVRRRRLDGPIKFILSGDYMPRK